MNVRKSADAAQGARVAAALAAAASLLAVSWAVVTLFGLEKNRTTSIACIAAGVTAFGVVWLAARRSQSLHRHRWPLYALSGLMIAGGLQLWSPAQPADLPSDQAGAVQPGSTAGRPTVAASDVPSTLCQEAGDNVMGNVLYQVPGNPSRFGGDTVEPRVGEAMAANPLFVAFVDVSDSRKVTLLDSSGNTVISRHFEGAISDLSISSAGVVVALESVAGNTRLTSWRTETDEVQVLVDPASEVSQPAISASGTAIAWVQETSEGPTILTDELGATVNGTEFANGTSPSWSPDASSIVYSAQFGDGRAVFAKTTESASTPWRITEPRGARDSDPVISPDCATVAFSRSTADETVVYRTSNEGREAARVGGSSPQIRPAFTS